MKDPQVLCTMRLDTKSQNRLVEIFGAGNIKFLRPGQLTSTGSNTGNVEILLVDGNMPASAYSLPGLRWVNCNQSGIEKSATPELFRSGLKVTSSAGRSGPALAEHALLFMLAITGNYSGFTRAQRLKIWGIRKQKELRGLHGKTITIIGCGGTGVPLAHLCTALGMEVRVYRRRKMACPIDGVSTWSRDAADSLDEAMQGSDVLALCASLNDTSYRMIGREQLDTLAPGAMVVNVARAQLVDMAALCAALEKGGLSGAGFDVTDPCEPLPPWHKWWRTRNLLITPHVTPQMPDRTGNTIEQVAANFQQYCRQEALSNQLSEEDIFTPRGGRQYSRPVQLFIRGWHWMARKVFT